MKKYIILTPLFPTAESFRGPFIYDQARAIQKTGRYEVIVFKSVPFSKKAADYEYDGLRVIQFHDLVLSSAAFADKLWPVSAVNLLAELKKANIDLKDIAVCHTHSASLIPLASFLQRQNPKIIAATQHHFAEPQWGRLGRFVWLRNYLCQNAAHLTARSDVSIAVSEHARSALNAHGLGRGKHNYTLYNGVDLNKFYPVPELRDHNTFHIGCVGNFIPLKDQMTLLRAAEKLLQNGMNDLKVSFIGSGPTLNECKKYA